MNQLKQANNLFTQGNFAEALTLYMKLKRSSDTGNLLDFNIELCKSRLAKVNSLPKLGDVLLDAGISQCYVINLKRRMDRKIKTILEFNKQKIFPKFIDATDADFSDVASDMLLRYQNRIPGTCDSSNHISFEIQKYHKTKLNKACFALLLSFRKVFEDAKSNNFKRICIFEDDVFFTTSAATEFMNFIQAVDNKWKVILLGASEYSNIFDSSDFLNNLFYHPVPGQTCGAFGVAYDSAVFQDILYAIGNADGVFDNHVMGHIYNKYPKDCYVINPNICIPDVANSNIRTEKREQQTQAEKMKWDITNYKSYKTPISIAIIISNLNTIKYISNFTNNSADIDFSFYCLTEIGFNRIINNKPPTDMIVINQSIFEEKLDKQINWLLDNAIDLSHNYYVVMSYDSFEISESFLRLSLLSCLQSANGYFKENNSYYKYFAVLRERINLLKSHDGSIEQVMSIDTIPKDKIKIVIGVTTYNRIDYLKSFIKSWNSTRNQEYSYTLIVSDDGSNDGTLEYLDSLVITDVDIYIIKHNRTGVHESTNSIINRCQLIDFDYGFKCDDDVIFQCTGWDDAYIKGMKKYPYMCNYNVGWRKSKPLGYDDGFIAYSNAYYSQGAFWTFTKEVINKVGWFDTKTFGFKGYGHIDYSVRACRAGFNKFDTFFDILDSSKYVTLQLEDYKPAISVDKAKEEFFLTINEQEKERLKVKILEERSNVIHVERNSIYEFQLYKKKPNIYFFIVNNHIGGAENVHFTHALALRELNFNVKIYSVTRGQTFERFEQNNFEIIHTPSLFDSIDNFKSTVSLIPDGSYIYDCNTWRPDFFAELAKIKYIYYLSIIHSDIPNTINNCLKSLEFTYRYLCIHKGIVRSLSEKGVPAHIVKLVPNSLDNEFKFGYNNVADVELRNKLNIPSNNLVICFVGRIAKDKNPMVALEIFNLLKIRRADVTMIIIGGESFRNADKGYYQEFESKLKSIKDSNIIYLNEKKSDEINHLLNVVDVAINVSPSEGLPISMLEQLAMGVFCVYPNFVGIESTLNSFPAQLINIVQRSSNSINAKYSESEINLFVDEIAKLRRQDILPLKKKISDSAFKVFSFTKLITSLNEAF